MRKGVVSFSELVIWGLANGEGGIMRMSDYENNPDDSLSAMRIRAKGWNVPDARIAVARSVSVLWRIGMTIDAGRGIDGTS
jgi:hypothetical protein